MRGRSWRGISLACACLVTAWLGWCGGLRAQEGGELPALMQQVFDLQNAGKYSEAEPLAERLVPLVKAQYGETSEDHAIALETLADTYFFQQKYTAAEPVYQQALAIRERVLGTSDASVLKALDRLASLYRFSGRPQLAEPLLKRVLAERESGGARDPSVGNALKSLAEVEITLQRYDDAEAHVRRALSLSEGAGWPPVEVAQLFGTLAQVQRVRGKAPEAERSLKQALDLHEQAARSSGRSANEQALSIFAMLQLAGLYQETDRYQEATVVAERVLAMIEKLLGPDHPNVASQLELVASLYGHQRRYAEAETLRKRALAINERAYGPEHINVASSLQGLGILYGLQDRHEEALPFLLRALAIAEKALGPDHASLSFYLSQIGEVHRREKRYGDAERFLKRALANLDNETTLDPILVGVQRMGLLQSLGFLYQSQERHDNAQLFLERALAVSEQLFGAEHTSTGGLLSTIATYLAYQDRRDEAEQLFQRALPIMEKLGRDSDSYASTLGSLGMVHFKREDWAKAYAAMRTASAIYIALDQRGVGALGRTEPRQQSMRYSELLLLQAVTAYHLAEANATEVGTLRDEAFQIVQRAQSSQAAAALGQMAARFSSGTGALANLVRERQDLASEWQSLDRRVTASLSSPPAQRNAEKEQALRQRLTAVSERLNVLTARLVKEFPQYAALASPQPLSIAEAQRLLGPSEALLLIATRRHQSLVWAVSKDAVEWTLVPLGDEELAREVAALRCGLDTAAWQAERGPSCASLLGTAHASDRPLPFDLARAHVLYEALLAPFKSIIAGKHLLIAASGPATALPFSVLVTEKPETALPEAAGYANAAWLAKAHALTALPSVASLASLRAVAGPSAARNPFVGFGNPLLTGSDGADRRAWARQSCPKQAPQNLLRVASKIVPDAYTKLFRGTLGNAEALRRQTPLPETTDELCAVARDLRAPERDVLLGSRATESAIKRLSGAGQLSTYRVLHFATHGLLAGETESLGSGAEPALLLTPPDQPTEADDGLLTASEVAKLQLNADWVVLSACNTAAGARADAQPLSGLAQAFFYAGARALLVSHWYVDSDAAVKLVTRTFAEARRDPQIGRAEALRRGMLALLADTSRPADAPAAAHPSVWAPFVVVGEGGVVR